MQNLIVLFRQDMRNLRQLHEHTLPVTCHSKNCFLHRTLLNNSEYSFAVLDLTSATDSGRTDVGLMKFMLKSKNIIINGKNTERNCINFVIS